MSQLCPAGGFTGAVEETMTNQASIDIPLTEGVSTANPLRDAVREYLCQNPGFAPDPHGAVQIHLISDASAETAVVAHLMPDLNAARPLSLQASDLFVEARWDLLDRALALRALHCRFENGGLKPAIARAPNSPTSR